MKVNGQIKQQITFGAMVRGQYLMIGSIFFTTFNFCWTLPLLQYPAQKLIGGNIIIALSLKVAAPAVFSVFLHVSCVGTDKISAS
jgi:hypothetical protein